MEEARPTGVARPVGLALGGAALLALACAAFVPVLTAFVDGDDADVGRAISIATALGGVMEAAFFGSCWAAWVATSRLLHARPDAARRAGATLVAISWFGCLVAIQFAILGRAID